MPWSCVFWWIFYEKSSDLLHTTYVVSDMPQMKSWTHLIGRNKTAIYLATKTAQEEQADNSCQVLILRFLHVTYKPVSIYCGLKEATEHCETKPSLQKWHSFCVIIDTKMAEIVSKLHTGSWSTKSELQYIETKKLFSH